MLDTILVVLVSAVLPTAVAAYAAGWLVAFAYYLPSTGLSSDGVETAAAFAFVWPETVVERLGGIFLRE